MADNIRRILAGDVTNLPRKESNIVRIFTSSTFTDTTEERNRLIRDVYPSLRTFCQQRGLEFQVVDMRWGVRDEATADHKTNELCMQEIKNCQRLTPGPNFVGPVILLMNSIQCLLGDKYGYRPFPHKIKATEFEILLEVARETYDQPEHIDLLLEWFWKDTNAIPAEYVLQPITYHFPHYTDLSEANEELNRQERDQWWKIFQSFQRIFKWTARIATERRKISLQQAHKYFSSVTEKEIEHGILGSSSPDDQTLCYIRHISDIQVNLTDQNSRKYTDVSEGEHDLEAQDLLIKLKRDRLLQRLGENNITRFEIPWSNGGINVSDRMHEQYLNNFCHKFESDVQRLINKSLQNAVREKAMESSLYKEVLHHAWFCQDKCEAFRGREDVLQKIRTSLKDFEKIEPLVIYGSSGSGKTSIMAVVAKSARQWLGDGTVCVFRFLGTSPDSSSIRFTITSICLQICEVYSLEAPKGDILEDFSQLVRFFHGLVTRLPVSAAKPLVLILDSIDQLSATNNAHLMNWLPKKCPQFIKIVISVLPNYYQILSNLRRSLPIERCYIEVPFLTIEMGKEILEAWLQGIGRTLTQEQFELVLSSFAKCPQPLFLKLIFTEASRWDSYTDVTGLDLGGDVRQAIQLLFERLERKHGKTLTSRALCYITAGRNGITANELEDVLSLDDDVIDDVYQYWDPPVEGVVRLPNLLWARIRHDIEEFLTERQADGKTVIAWYHRQFWEAAQSHYLSKPDEKQARHLLLAEYFEGRWGGGRKKRITLTHRKKTLPDADRQVSSQPLMFSKSVFNLRKLSEMPIHLIYSGLSDRLASEVLFNFQWIYGKVRGQSLSEVLEDYVVALEVRPDLDVRFVHDTLILAWSNIKQDVDCLATQLLGRLLTFREQFPRIANLITQCYCWCDAQRSPLFIPQCACLISAGGPLKTNLRGHEQRVNEIAVTRDDKFIVTSGEDSLINVWNSSNLDCLHTLKMADKGPSCLVLSLDDKYVIGSAIASIGVWDIDSGEAVQRFHNEGVVTCLATGFDGAYVVTGGDDGIVRVWKTFSGTKEKTLSGHEGPINAIAISPNDEIITGSNDSTLRVWSLSSGECQAVYDGHMSSVLCLVLTCDGESVISGSEDKTVKAWHLKTKSCATFKGHSGLVKCLACMKDGRRIVSGSKDESLKIWDLVTLQCCVTLKGHSNAIWRVAVASDDSFIVSASKDDTLKVWNPATGECQRTLIGHSSWISCVSITTDCKTIISGSNDKNVKLWYAAGNEHACDISTVGDRILHRANLPECVAITTDGHWGLSGSKNDSLKLWDISSTRCIKSVSSSIACIFALHNSTRVVTGMHNGEITIWNCSTLQVEKTFKVHQGSVVSIKVSKDDSFVVSASSDNTVGLTQISEGHAGQLAGHSDAVLCVSLLSGEDYAISGSKDKSVRLWNLKTMNCERSFEGHTGPVGCLASTTDNKNIVSGSEDFKLKVWSIQNGDCLHTLEGHNASIKCIAITEDNLFAVAGSHEGKEQLLLWNLKTGDRAKSFIGHIHAVMHLKVLPRDMMVTSSRDGTIKLWNIVRGKMINSFDFQSQVKYFVLHPVDGGYSVMLATQSGTVSILKLQLSKEVIEESSAMPTHNVSDTLDEGSSATKATPYEEARCSFCGNTNCCRHCALM